MTPSPYVLTFRGRAAAETYLVALVAHGDAGAVDERVPDVEAALLAHGRGQLGRVVGAHPGEDGTGVALLLAGGFPLELPGVRN